MWINVERPWEIVSAFSTIGMAFVNHSIVVEATSGLRNPTHYRQHTLTYASSIVTTSLYILTSVTGYLHFGNDVKGNILDSYGENGGLEITLARILVAICIALTYPAFITPARACLSGLFKTNSDYRRVDSGVRGGEGHLLLSDLDIEDDIPTSRKWSVAGVRVAQTLFIFGLSFMIAVLVPSLDKIFAFFGSLTGSLVVYVLPVWFFINIGSRYRLIHIDWLQLFALPRFMHTDEQTHVWFPRVRVLGYLNYDQGSPVGYRAIEVFDGE